MSTLRAVILALALATLTCGPTVGGQTRTDVARTFHAFADADGDGVRDESEAPLPDVLVISDSNIHGTFTRLARFTDADGRVVITVTYTHFFDVKVVPPCGYTPTTATSFSAGTSRREIEVGFQPNVPQADQATVWFHLWDDKNENGIQDPDEEPVGTVYLPLDISVVDETSTTPGQAPDNANTNELAVRIEGGRGEISLGNSCGILRVNLSALPLWEPVFTSPEAVFEEYNGSPTGVLRFEYTIGQTDIEIGLSASGE